MPPLSVEHVWVWDGPANNLGPSIYGLGEPTRLLGAENIFAMWPSSKTSTRAALDKLRGFRRVVWELTCSKWRKRTCTVEGEEKPRVAFFMDDSWGQGRGEESWLEAETISRLSPDYPNLAGGLLDYSFGGFAHRGGTPEHLKRIRDALRSENPTLRLFWMTYARDADPKWADYLPHLDVINLWEPDPQNLKKLDETVERCARAFPGKPILLGLYLVHYWARKLEPGEEDEWKWHHEWALRPLPEDLLELQFSKAVRLTRQGKIIGFSILAESMLDKFPETAEWVRRFLGEHVATVGR